MSASRVKTCWPAETEHRARQRLQNTKSQQQLSEDNPLEKVSSPVRLSKRKRPSQTSWKHEWLHQMPCLLLIKCNTIATWASGCYAGRWSKLEKRSNIWGKHWKGMECDNTGAAQSPLFYGPFFSWLSNMPCWRNTIDLHFWRNPAWFRRHVEDAERRELLENGFSGRSSQDTFADSQREQVKVFVWMSPYFLLSKEDFTGPSSKRSKMRSRMCAEDKWQREMFHALLPLQWESSKGWLLRAGFLLQNYVQNSKKLVEEMLENGATILVDMSGQRDRLKVGYPSS